jgi:hypothetical protein
MVGFYVITQDRLFVTDSKTLEAVIFDKLRLSLMHLITLFNEGMKT